MHFWEEILGNLNDSLTNYVSKYTELLTFDARFLVVRCKNHDMKF